MPHRACVARDSVSGLMSALPQCSVLPRQVRHPAVGSRGGAGRERREDAPALPFCSTVPRSEAHQPTLMHRLATCAVRAVRPLSKVRAPSGRVADEGGGDELMDEARRQAGRARAPGASRVVLRCAAVRGGGHREASPVRLCLRRLESRLALLLRRNPSRLRLLLLLLSRLSSLSLSCLPCACTGTRSESLNFARLGRTRLLRPSLACSFPPSSRQQHPCCSSQQHPVLQPCPHATARPPSPALAAPHPALAHVLRRPLLPAALPAGLQRRPRRWWVFAASPAEAAQGLDSASPSSPSFAHPPPTLAPPPLTFFTPAGVQGLPRGEAQVRRRTSGAVRAVHRTQQRLRVRDARPEGLEDARSRRCVPLLAAHRCALPSMR